MVIAAPLFLCGMLMVKISSPGPIFYAHSRVGRNGQLFLCWKFRTMYQDAEAQLQPLLATNPTLQQEWATYFKLKTDPRITSVGRWLRKTSLDELPQIWNVFKGDMSVVGPRPLTQHEVIHYLREKAATILSVRPGLTTLWIIRGRNALSLEERIALETHYVTNRSFWLDCRLIFRTFLLMIFPNGS
jgi:undecaprenyl-phosphate galactose phosphotransferase